MFESIKTRIIFLTAIVLILYALIGNLLLLSIVVAVGVLFLYPFIKWILNQVYDWVQMGYFPRRDLYGNVLPMRMEDFPEWVSEQTRKEIIEMEKKEVG